MLTVPGTPIGSGAVPGEYVATFSKESNPGAELEGLEDDEIMRRGGLRPPVSLLPLKYRDRTVTPIAPVKVERRGKNTFTFALESK